ncbi:hypothetical protein DSUL_80050 [Desulfovibrionales bacterium]
MSTSSKKVFCCLDKKHFMLPLQKNVTVSASRQTKLSINNDYFLQSFTALTV